MDRKMQIVGVLVILAGLYLVQFNPGVEAPYAPDKQLITTTTGEVGDYMAANGPWSKGDGSDEASSIYYPNCAAARSSGAAPIHRGERGYVADKDLDGDGTVCETPDAG